MEKIKFCPFCSCENTVELKEEQRQHIVKDALVKGLFYFYKCSSCKGEFTTTKLDEKSLKNFTHKKM